jgi:hypothetical protein
MLSHRMFIPQEITLKILLPRIHSIPKEMSHVKNVLLCHNAVWSDRKQARNLKDRKRRHNLSVQLHGLLAGCPT